LFGFSRIFLGILLGVFVIPVIYADPVGTFETIQSVVSKLSELAGAIGGVVS
jgi:hypothetical protein